jgi:hypothetical protein
MEVTYGQLNCNYLLVFFSWWTCSKGSVRNQILFYLRFLTISQQTNKNPFLFLRKMAQFKSEKAKKLNDKERKNKIREKSVTLSNLRRAVTIKNNN